MGGNFPDPDPEVIALVEEAKKERELVAARDDLAAQEVTCGRMSLEAEFASHDLAMLLWRRGRVEEAIPLQQNASAIREEQTVMVKIMMGASWKGSAIHARAEGYRTALEAMIAGKPYIRLGYERPPAERGW